VPPNEVKATEVAVAPEPNPSRLDIAMGVLSVLLVGEAGQ
jgi:hypothetical protein